MFTPPLEFLLFYYTFIIFTFILPFPQKSLILASLYLLSFAKYCPDILELPRWCSGKEIVCQCRRHRRCEFDAWVGKIPWRRKWQPTSVFLPGKSDGQRSLMGYSPRVYRRVRHD